MVSFLYFLGHARKNERRSPRNQPALGVPSPAYSKTVATLSLYPILNICFGSLLAREEKLFYPPSRFAKVVLKKVATSCGAATAFFSAALGTRMGASGVVPPRDRLIPK
jgi:hypothetical protein